MAAGPILIFDKSALQALTVDESVMLDHFFLTNITPMFFVETLADLEKPDLQGRTSEEAVVRDLVLKTPDALHPNVFHRTLLVQNLLGNPVPMTGQILIPGGVRKPDGRGGVSVVVAEPPEAQAVRRWKAGQFGELERLHARSWRAGIENIDVTSRIEMARRTVPPDHRITDLASAKLFADSFVARADREVLMFALQFLDIPVDFLDAIDRRYAAAGRPRFSDFAPYAAFVLAVDLTFFLSPYAMGKRTNVIDISYLYYLPFCMVFTSKDKIHARLAPMFMRSRQQFVWGEDLKAGLKTLDEHYTQFGDEIERRGLISFIHEPPTEPRTVISDLWDHCLRLDGVEDAARDNGTTAPRESSEDLLRRINRITESTDVLPEGEMDREPDSVILHSRVSPRRGKWRILPQGMGDEEPKRQ